MKFFESCVNFFHFSLFFFSLPFQNEALFLCRRRRASLEGVNKSQNE